MSYASGVFINIGSGHSLLPNVTKPSPESMLTYLQLDPYEQTPLLF